MSLPEGSESLHPSVGPGRNAAGGHLWTWLRSAASAASRGSLALAGLRRLHDAVRFAFPQRNAVVIIVGLTLCVAGVNAVEPLILKFVFDELADMRRFHELLQGVLLLAGLAVLRECLEAVANWLTWRTRLGLQYALLEAVIGKLHRMPLRM